MTTLVTLNVSREQIEQDLRAGKSVEEISQEWSEPRANVFAVQRALATASAPRPSPVQVVMPRSVPAVPANAAAGVLALVNEASQSKHARTRALGTKLDQLVEELEERLTAERAEAEEAQRKRRERDEATAEVARLEAALREARARAGLRGAGVARGNTSPRTDTQIDSMARAREAARGEFPCSKGCAKVSSTKAGQLSHERHCAGRAG